MSQRYLTTAANEISALSSNGNLANAAAVGCDALRELADDEEFRGYAEELTRRWFVNRKGFNDVTKSLEHFSFFLEAERQILIDNNLEPRLVDELLRQAKQARQSIQRWNGDIDTLFVLIAQVRDEACNLANVLRTQLEDDIKRRKQIRRIIYVVAGGAIIAINIGCSTVLTPVGSTVSGALGAGFISQAIPVP